MLQQQASSHARHTSPSSMAVCMQACNTNPLPRHALTPATGTHAMQQPDGIRDAQLCLPTPCQQHRAKLLPPTRCAIPSPHLAARRAKPRVPDHDVASSPAPSRVPRARPRKHAIAGHQWVAAASRWPPRACRCPGSLSIASLPVGCCPTAPPSHRVDSPSRIPSAELPEPPLTGKHELRVRGSRPSHRLPAPINSPTSLAASPRTSQALHSLSLPRAPTAALHKPPLLQTTRRRRSPSTSRPNPR
jgi:hypothetical protein